MTNQIDSSQKVASTLFNAIKALKINTIWYSMEDNWLAPSYIENSILFK